MNAIIGVLTLALVVGILLFVPTLAAPYQGIYGPVTLASCGTALGLCAVTALVAGIAIKRNRDDGSYLVKLFLLALLVRLAIGTVIFVSNGQDFFGGDAWTYDFFGYQQLLAWRGDIPKIRIQFGRVKLRSCRVVFDDLSFSVQAL